MALRMRELTSEEQEAIRHLARLPTAATRLVERAAILWFASQRALAPQISRKVGVSEKSGRFWMKRFQAEGLPGLEDRPHPGRPPIYPREVVE